ncbi:unnamed protein product [Anisakis simplex]|uniref:Uncharacterized protein n=1 Tax=Anisakis simplex TaxID=6269 RepID=A0A0M3JYS5_ANISI|nr:unnamed protein product [Anisakis simplex]
MYGNFNAPGMSQYAIRKQSRDEDEADENTERHQTPPLLTSRLSMLGAKGIESGKALNRVLSQHWNHSADAFTKARKQFRGRFQPLHMRWKKRLE